MKYSCNFCSYDTDRLFSYNKHLSTKKHIAKVREQNKKKIKSQNIHKPFIKHSLDIHKKSENVYECPYCENTYSSSSNLIRHKKSCSKKDQLESEFNTELEKKEYEIQRLKELYEKDTIHLKELYEKDTSHLKELHEKDDKLNKQLQDENKHLKSLISNAGGIIKTSVSALAYVAQNYEGAPVLKKLKDYSYIKEIELDEDDSNDEFDLIDTLIHHNMKETIQEYLGNIIVEAYKKKDPNKQSIWNSDTTRLTYIIKDLINKKPDWTVDKKGIKTGKYIIDPLLEYIRKEVAEYILENDAEKYLHLGEFMLNKHAEKLNSCGSIIASIDNKALSKLVLKYIAPHFYLAKPEQLIES